MRLLALLTASSLIALSAVSAQSVQPPLARWEAGPVVLAGPGLLVGGSLSFRVVQSSRLSLSADVSGFTPLLKQYEWACQQSASGCRNGSPMPQASALAFVGVRSTIPAYRRWYGVADAGLVAGHWRYPVAGTHHEFAGGLGMGHLSRSERRSLELRWQSVGSGGAPVSTYRLGWLHRW